MINTMYEWWGNFHYILARKMSHKTMKSFPFLALFCYYFVPNLIIYLRIHKCPWILDVKHV